MNHGSSTSHALCLKVKSSLSILQSMTTTTVRIYNKACNMCDRPALTFDRDNRPFCPQHASIFLVRAGPFKSGVPAATSLSG
jgi:hypothetical protein